MKGLESSLLIAVLFLQNVALAQESRVFRVEVEGPASAKVKTSELKENIKDLEVKLEQLEQNITSDSGVVAQSIATGASLLTLLNVIVGPEVTTSKNRKIISGILNIAGSINVTAQKEASLNAAKLNKSVNEIKSALPESSISQSQKEDILGTLYKLVQGLNKFEDRRSLENHVSLIKSASQLALIAMGFRETKLSRDDFFRNSHFVASSVLNAITLSTPIQDSVNRTEALEGVKQARKSLPRVLLALESS